MSEHPTRPTAPANLDADSITPSPDATWFSLPVAVPPPTAPVLPVVPGYGVLAELGRGGMGVVYKARQAGLNRLVALKMILAGGYADEADLARFRTEAEAIARLRHPNIVQIYEVGEHEGRPFFSLELCIGSLEQKLKGAPLPPRDAAALMEVLARAMEACHRQNVVHRDLKPANVLLTDDGTPKITDFGLAKKMGEVGQTQSGAVMGTPSFMAPEQASGQSAAIGPATDVYALGAILYECLTGRPPFKAATMMETLSQVLHDEPAPPRQLNARTPPDLETICLKCLRKEPARRYARAAELAEDLGRFQRGEPIAARPVGRVERCWRWCRRHPAVSGLAAAVALCLLVGTAVSAYFAVDASRQAVQSHTNEETAKRNEASAKQNEATAKANAAAAEAARNDLLTTAARSLLRPLGVQVQANQTAPPLSDPEIGALWELAVSPESDVRIRFIQEALREPAPTRQLRDRAAYALQAAVGLDVARRTRVEKLLAERLLAAETPDQREDAALILAQFGVRDPALAGKVARTLGESAGGTTDLHLLQALAEGLWAVAPRLEPRASAAAFSQAADALGRAMTGATDPHTLQDLAESLAVLAPKLDRQEATAVCSGAGTVLSQAMTTTTNPTALEALAQGLSAVAPWMGPKEANDATTALLQALPRLMDPSQLRPLARGLGALAPQLEPKEAAEGAAMNAQSIAMQADPLQAFGPVVPPQPAQLGPTEAGLAAASMTQILSRTTDVHQLQGPIQGLLTVAPCLGSKDAGAAAAAVIQAMTRTTDPGTLHWLALALPAVAERLEPKEAAEATDVLVQAVAGTTNSTQLQDFAEGLSATAARMEPNAAAATLTRAVAGTTNPHQLQALAAGLSASAAQLGPKEAAASCGQASAVLTRSIARTTEPDSLRALADGLSAIGPHLEAKEALDAAAALTQARAMTTDAQAVQALTAGLSALVTGMGPAERRRRIAALASVFGAPADSLTLTTSWPLLQPATEPLPAGLPTAQLAALLKHPLCVGEARRVVLDQLGWRYGRPFEDPWDFVQFAEEQKLGLDFTSPPRPSDAGR